MVEIIKDFIQQKGKVRPYINRDVRYVVIHDTGNTSKGAGASAHNNYIKNLAKENTTSKSWHYTVDDRSVYQHIPDNEVAWACGDGNGPGNQNGISIELCINSDGNFTDTLENASCLVAQLLLKWDLTINAIKRHKDFANKDCPATLNKNKELWEDFISDVNVEYGRLVNKTVKHWCEDDVAYLKTIGVGISETRYDDAMTRAEVISLNARVARKLRGE